MADAGASIQQVQHDRIFSGADMTRVQLVCTVETEDAAHAQRVLAHLESTGTASGIRAVSGSIAEAAQLAGTKAADGATHG